MPDLRLDISPHDIQPISDALERLEDMPVDRVAYQDVSLSSGPVLRLTMDYWDRLVRHLREKHPLVNHRLSVRRSKRRSECGITYPPGPGGTISIRVDGEQTLQEQLDTLLHEWAHAECFDRGTADAHEDAWGVALAQIYRTWEAWNGGH